MTPEVLTVNARGRLVDELCRLYPTYDDLNRFLSLRLDSALANLAAPGPLVQVAFDVVRAAEARGWIRDLVTAAAAHSPHSEFLQLLAAAKAPGARTDVVPEARLLDVVLVASERWEPLAAAVRADPRVHRCRCSATADALGRADAVVVSDEVVWAGEHPPEFGAVPIVLLATGPDPSSWPDRPLAHAVAARVTQIVGAGPHADTARRIVDHLVGVVGRTP